MGVVWVALLAATTAAPPPLGIVKAALHQYEDGPALAPEYVFAPGETVFFDFLVQGYKVSSEQRIELECRIEAVDAEGTLLAEPFRQEIKVELAPEDKDWMPKVRHSVPAPPLGDPGTYRIRILVRDLLAGSETRLEIPFRTGGRQVAPSDTLVERNFRFLRSEEDRTPLRVAAYRPGDALWARFEIRGYKHAEKNQVHVEYGLEVLGPGGQSLYREAQAAVEQSSSFYPKRYLPGSLSLNLQANARPGEYTIVLRLRDLVGGQESESRHSFKIE